MDSYTAFSWLKGKLGETLVQEHISSNLDKGIVIIDGHNAHSFHNLKGRDGIQPCHLDIVGIDKKRNIKFIYEVKTTITSNSIFHANGYCSVFMTQAKESGIPVYLAVVRLDRDFDKKALRAFDSKTKRILVDQNVWNKEIRYFRKNAKIEIYDQSKFDIDGDNFVIKQ